MRLRGWTVLLDHLKIEKAHIVGYSMGGIITAKFLAKHPDRALSGTLCGAGWLREGGLEQKVFASATKDGKIKIGTAVLDVDTQKPAGLCFKSLATLALTEKEIKSIKVPVRMLFGDKDTLMAAYGEPARKVRMNWDLIPIKDADHMTCVFKPQFRNEIQKWLAEQKKKQ